MPILAEASLLKLCHYARALATAGRTTSSAALPNVSCHICSSENSAATRSTYAARLQQEPALPSSNLSQLSSPATTTSNSSSAEFTQLCTVRHVCINDKVPTSTSSHAYSTQQASHSLPCHPASLSFTRGLAYFHRIPKELTTPKPLGTPWQPPPSPPPAQNPATLHPVKHYTLDDYLVTINAASTPAKVAAAYPANKELCPLTATALLQQLARLGQPGLDHPQLMDYLQLYKRISDYLHAHLHNFFPSELVRIFLALGHCGLIVQYNLSSRIFNILLSENGQELKALGPGAVLDVARGLVAAKHLEPAAWEQLGTVVLQSCKAWSGEARARLLGPFEWAQTALPTPPRNFKQVLGMLRA